MKKLITLWFSSIIFFVGCVSNGLRISERDPASKITRDLKFDLYGRNKPAPVYSKFDIIDLQKLREKTVAFTTIPYSPDVDQKLDQWQNELLTVANDTQKEDGIKFDTKHFPVKASTKLLNAVIETLTLIDQSESNDDLRRRKKIEIIEAFNEQFKRPFDMSINILTIPLLVIDTWAGPTIKIPDETRDLKVHPSSFWSPQSSGSVNMWSANGKFDFENIMQQTCIYDEAKKGFGVHPGFKVKCGNTKLKYKLGNETHSGPFNSRIYTRLGYNVPAIHYVPGLKVKYTRDLFSEFNSRKPNPVNIKAGPAPVFKFKKKFKDDAITYIKEVVLKNGKRHTPEQFRTRLLKNCDKHPCNYSDSNIVHSYEKNIDHVIFTSGSVTEYVDGVEIGPWSYSRLDHPDRPELRALVLLGAWTGNFDLRKENNRIIYDDAKRSIKHYISDPGSGLGDSYGILRSSNMIHSMSWTATIETSLITDEDKSKHINIKNYSELETNDAFRKVTYEDLKWMAKLIAGVSEQEISDALAASGLRAAEFVMAREKLISIQQHLIKHFGMEKEFPIKRSINKNLNFHPDHDSLSIQLSSGRTYKFENGGVRLQDGNLIYPPGQETKHGF